AERIKRRDGKLRPFVGDEFAGHEVIIFDFPGRNALEQLHVDWRMDHHRVPAIIFFNAGGDGRRIGDEAIDPHRRARIPNTQIMAKWRHHETPQPAGALAVVVKHVPDVAHGRVTITYMHRARGWD